MKRSITERRAKALELLKNSSFDQSRAKRTGSLTREEWQARKDADIAHLEVLLHVRQTS